MFGDGEIDIFRRSGMLTVFFAQTIVGSRMPNLTYMLAYDDLAARDKTWRAFSADPTGRSCAPRPASPTRNREQHQQRDPAPASLFADPLTVAPAVYAAVVRAPSPVRARSRRGKIALNADHTSESLYRRLQQHLDRMPVGFPATHPGLRFGFSNASLLPMRRNRAGAERIPSRRHYPQALQVAHHSPGAEAEAGRMGEKGNILAGPSREKSATPR